MKKAQNIAQKNHKKFISIASVSIIAIAIGVVFFNQKTNTLDNIVLKEDGKEFMNDENNKVSGFDSKKKSIKGSKFNQKNGIRFRIYCSGFR